jgi:putative oxidoreductase
MRLRGCLGNMRASRETSEATMTLSDRTRHRLRLAAIWIPTALLLLIFLPQGWAKFSATSGWAAAFRHWGYPAWFRILVGIAELGGCAMLLWGRTAVFGALLLIAVMLGAWGTHLAFDHGRNMTSEIVPLTLATIVLLGRRRGRDTSAPPIVSVTTAAPSP